MGVCRGERAFETTQDKFFPLTPWAAAVRSKPETLLQWAMKSESQLWVEEPLLPHRLRSHLLTDVGCLFLKHFIHCTPCVRNQQRLALTYAPHLLFETFP